MITDRMLAAGRVRQAIAALLEVRTRVERGEMESDSREAEGAASRAVLAALGTQHKADAASNAQRGT